VAKKIVGRVLLKVVVGAVLMLGLLVPWCRLAESGTLVAAPAPSAEPPRAPRIRAEGRVVAYPGAEVTVGTELGGTIARVLVSEKQTVHAGDLLAELGSEEQKAAVAEARARVLEADANAELSRVEVARAERLLAREVSTEQSLDRLRQELAVARARKDVAAAIADRLTANLAKLRITAPIDGVVVSRFVHPGETLAPGSRLFTIADLGRLRISAEVDESDASSLVLGAGVTITAEGFAERSWRGKIEEIPDAVSGRQLKPQDPGRPIDTRVILAKIALGEATPLRLGQRVELEIGD
jgi:macrolide-specific efflux system membrane fusion protein